MNVSLKIKGYFDGSFKDGYGIGGWYFKIVRDKNNFISIKNSTYTKVQDSIMAEYIGLIGLLKNINEYIINWPIKHIKIYGDCQGVIKRVKNKCRFNRVKYRVYNKQVDDLIKQIKIPVIFKQINRKENKIADKICRQLTILDEIEIHKILSVEINELPEEIQKLRKVNHTNLKFKPTPKYDRVIELLSEINT
jgi:ribonuclease HI